MSEVRAVRINDDIANNLHNNDYSVPVMTSFKSKKGGSNTVTSDLFLPSDHQVTSSRHSGRPQQLGGKAVEANNATRYNRKSNVIRIDARDQNGDAVKREAGSLKRRQSSSTVVASHPASDVYHTSRYPVSSLPSNRLNYAPPGAMAPFLPNDARFSSIVKSHDVTEAQSAHAGQKVNQSELSTLNSCSQSKRFTQGPQRSSNRDAGLDLSPGIPQGDTLPYTHRPRQQGKNDSVEGKAPSRVTFASREKGQTKPVQPIKQQQSDAYERMPDKKLKDSRCSRHRMFYCIIMLLIVFLLVTILVFTYFLTTRSSDVPGKLPGNLQPAPSPQPSPTLPPVVDEKTTTRRTGRDWYESRRCYKEESLAIANRILSKLDNSVDPCQDFYSYACGGWLSNNPIPPGSEEFGVVSKIAERNNRILHELLVRDEVAFENISKAEAKAKRFYASCLDLSTIEVLGAKPLFDLLTSLHGWDALGTWEEERWDLNEAIYQSQGRLSLSVFFAISLDVDPDNSTGYALVIDQKGTLTLEDEVFYVGPRAAEFEAKLKRAMHAILRLLTLRDYQHVVDDVYDFERKLAQIHVSGYQRQNWQKITIRELSALCPQIEWFSILHRIFSGVRLTTDTQVMVWGPTSYFSDLSRIMSNTTSRTLHNYVMWRVVFSRAHRLSLAFRRATSSLIYDILGIEAEQTRWRDCLGYVKAQFGDALGMMFVKEHFSLDSKLKIEEMTRQIAETFQANLEGLKWLDRSAREKMIEQLRDTSVKVGFKQIYLDNPESLNDLYQFEVEPRSFFKNFLESVRFKVERAATKLSGAVDDSEWRLQFSETNGYYFRGSGEMILPAGLLQPPIFDPDAPEAVNYGAIGSTIGHELIHAFDDLGRDNLPVSDEVYKNYTDRLECVVQKYHKFDALWMAGERTLFENIADMAGVKLAFGAYRNRAKIERRAIPGFTNNQLFFISFAQTWCTKRSARSTRAQLTEGMHALEKYRVIGSLSQFDQFARAFHCERETPMNPDSKCEVW